MKLRLEDLEAEKEAESRVEEFGFDALPVCPFKIAQELEIEVQPKDCDAPGVSGFLMKVGDSFGICYATHIKNDGFIRFTVAHELAHYFLPGHCEALFQNGNMLHQSRSGFVSNEPRERQADVFATTLLMPQKLFVAAQRTAGEGFQAIQALSQSCQTSITSTAIRYARFAEDPVAIVMSTGQYIDYCFMSGPIEQHPTIRWIKKGDALPPNSRTAQFNRTKSNVTSGRTDAGYTSLDDWFEGAPQVEMKEDVVGLGTYGRTLSVLFTSEPLGGDDLDGDDDVDDNDNDF